MLHLFFLGLLVAACSSFTIVDKEMQNEWNTFKLRFNKTYSGDEEARRLITYYSHKLSYVQHNKEAAAGLHTYSVGPNEYSDMTMEEIKTRMNGYKGVENKPKDGQQYDMSTSSNPIPASFDWRQEGIVTPVKNQKQCGSCWAFSSTGSLEGQNARKTKKLIPLSEQNLVDCCTGKYGNSGCGGGWMDNSFKYVKAVGGIDTEQYYPYIGKEEGRCAFNPYKEGAHDSGYVDIPKGNETALLHAVYNIGPISVAIDATRQGFASYKTGVYYDPSCSSTQLDHAVLVVGYGTENDTDYWLVKNSWGTSYGDQGYIKMARNRQNMCGIATAASYPLV